MATVSGPITSSMGENGSKKPELINKLEGHDHTVNAAVFIPGEEGVISVSDDR